MDLSERNVSFFKLQNMWPLYIYGCPTVYDSGVMS